MPDTIPRLTCLHRHHVDDPTPHRPYLCGHKHKGEEGARRCAMEHRGMFGRSLVDVYEVCPACQAAPASRAACATCGGQGTSKHLARYVNRTRTGRSSAWATMEKVVLDYGTLAWALRRVDKAREEGRDLVAYRVNWDRDFTSSHLDRVRTPEGVPTAFVVRQDYGGRSRLLDPEDEEALDWTYEERRSWERHAS